MKTPVALLIFNRLETTARVFAEIRKARPPQLLIIADGPRAGHPGDEEKCRATRAIVEHPDWDCEVLKNYSDVNLGTGQRPASGISWIFENVEEAIILEDDCLPHPTFFRFCDELLEYYRDDKRVMTISGNNFQYGVRRAAESYYFSIYPHTWGWATWRRAWQLYDFEARDWSQLRETKWLREALGDRDAAAHWRSVFDSVSSTSDGWDYQWIFCCWAQNALGVVPNVNLISNIGWGDDATHTKTLDHPSANLATEAMSFPLIHPHYMAINREADRFTLQNHFVGWSPKLYRRLKRRVLGRY